MHYFSNQKHIINVINEKAWGQAQGVHWMNTERWAEKHFWSVSAILEERVDATVSPLPGKPSYLRMTVYLQNKLHKFSKHVTLEKNSFHSSMWTLYWTYHQKDNL